MGESQKTAKFEGEKSETMTTDKKVMTFGDIDDAALEIEKQITAERQNNAEVPTP